MRRLPGIAAAVLIALATPVVAADWSHAEIVNVVATEYDFTPESLTFKHGVAYRLHFENRGKELHEFTAPEFFAAAELGNPEALNPDHTELVVQPGTAKDLLFVPKEAGQYRLYCADHDWAGMTGEITVE